MELKQSNFSDTVSLLACLNRTFYGIETTLYYCQRKSYWVLIVPFMELKHYQR